MPSLSLSSEVRVFPCPNCSETINTSMTQCLFCSTAIDHTAAEASAAATSRVSQACSDASYLKIMLGTLIPFGLLIFVPILGLVGLVGFVFVKYAVLVMTIRWWVKYRKIETTDPDFSKARGTTIFVAAIAVLVIAFLHVNLFGLRV
jgi:ABC-type Fe3+ transport system permease subunit